MKARRGGSNVAVVGRRQRKDADAFVRALAGGLDRIIALPLNEAHTPPCQIAALAEQLGLAASVVDSLSHAMQNAAQLHAPRVLICGSFLLAAEALALESA